MHLKVSLLEHATLSETKRSTTCSICKKVFSQKSSLVQHMLIHTGKSQYKCDVCGKTFVQKSACGKSNTKLHCFGNVSCKLCFLLNTHLQLTYLIDQTVLRNSYSSFVEVHKRRIHNTEKSFKCSECDYAAKILCDLQNHRMRMHSTDRSYKCDVCEEGFSTATRRNNHIAQGEVMHTASNVHFTDFERDVSVNTSFRD